MKFIIVYAYIYICFDVWVYFSSPCYQFNIWTSQKEITCMERQQGLNSTFQIRSGDYA